MTDNKTVPSYDSLLNTIKIHSTTGSPYYDSLDPWSVGKPDRFDLQKISVLLNAKVCVVLLSVMHYHTEQTTYLCGESVNVVSIPIIMSKNNDELTTMILKYMDQQDHNVITILHLDNDKISFASIKI